MGAENNIDMEERTLEIGMGMLSSNVPYLLFVYMIVQMLMWSSLHCYLSTVLLSSYISPLCI